MNRNRSLAALALMSTWVLASCGGGDDEAVAPPPGGPSDSERVAAATATVSTNPLCSATTLGAYYWEIGDASGVKASGSVGSSAPTATTTMWIFSSSKWLYAANVVEKHGVSDADVPYLNFTSGYSNYGNAPICTLGDGSTVAECLPPGGELTRDSNTVNKFKYDSGHMQYHAKTVMGLGAADNAALAADLNATVGNFGFAYRVPQLAAGVEINPQGYAKFLRKMLSGNLKMGAALGRSGVCTNPTAADCTNKAEELPEALPTNEDWRYDLGHWIEADATVGDGAFSSAGGGGFYPWIDKTKTYYGMVARETEVEPGAGFHSAQCGRLIRQAWRTGATVTSATPNPGS